MTLKYKDYMGSIRYSEKDKVYYGRILGIVDLISYEGENEKELEKNFKEAVDDYQETLTEEC